MSELHFQSRDLISIVNENPTKAFNDIVADR